MTTMASDQATQAQTPYTRRARYFDSGNAFNIVYPDVPAASFVAERDAALDPATGTGLIPCDQSTAMGIPFPATSPLVLASYARVRAGESLTFDARASVVLAYVIEGSGRALQGSDVISWSAGDVFCLPGGRPIELVSAARDSVAVAGHQRARARVRAPRSAGCRRGAGRSDPFPGCDHRRGARPRPGETRWPARCRPRGGVREPSSSRIAANISPSLTLAMNQLGPGEMQVAHRHNAVAVSLAINGDRCYSMVDKVRKDWQPFVTMVTPPGSVHSHHNTGTATANWLIVQDGGLHYHCRTMDFRFEDVPVHR